MGCFQNSLFSYNVLVTSLNTYLFLYFNYLNKLRYCSHTNNLFLL